MVEKSRADEDHDSLITIVADMSYVKKSLDIGSVKIADLPKQITALREEMNKQIAELRGDVNELNNWRNKIVGIAVGISTALSLAVSVVMSKLQK